MHNGFYLGIGGGGGGFCLSESGLSASGHASVLGGSSQGVVSKECPLQQGSANL